MKTNRKTINLRRKESTSNVRHSSTIASQNATNLLTTCWHQRTMSTNMTDINDQQSTFGNYRRSKTRHPQSKTANNCRKKWKRGQNVGRTFIPSHCSEATGWLPTQTIGEDSSTVRQRTTAPHAQLATTLTLIAELRNVDSHSVLMTSARVRQTISK